MDDPIWDVTAFSKKPGPTSGGGIARAVFERVLCHALAQIILLDEHTRSKPRRDSVRHREDVRMGPSRLQNPSRGKDYLGMFIGYVAGLADVAAKIVQLQLRVGIVV